MAGEASRKKHLEGGRPTCLLVILGEIVPTIVGTLYGDWSSIMKQTSA